MSATYREFTGLNLPAFEAEMLAQWSEKQAFEKSVSLREGATPFVFYEGPPSQWNAGYPSCDFPHPQRPGLPV